MASVSQLAASRNRNEFPFDAVKDNLYKELVVSQELFDIVKEIGNIIKEDKKLADSTSDSLRKLMNKTFNAGKTLSGDAGATGQAVRAYIDANRYNR